MPPPRWASGRGSWADALEDVGDVHVRPAEGDASEQGVEQLARGAHEGLALSVLVEAGRLTDDHDVRRTRPCTRHSLRAGRMQSAVLARPDGFVELEQLRGSAKRLSLQAWRT